jgi:hypothetical protein
VIHFELTTIHTVIFNFIVLLVVSVNSIDFMVTLYLQPINAYLNIFGMVFATGASFVHPLVASLTEVPFGSVEFGSFSPYNLRCPRRDA